MKNKLMKPKIWLIIIALMHLFLGVIGGYIMNGGNIDNLAVMIYLGITSIYLLYVAFMTEGQTQARFAVVLCAPIVVWFVIGFIMKLNFLGVPVLEMPSGLLPLTLWLLPTVTGFMNWDSE
tara:strand:- start:210 stop:572 length:363 start_codon:yes stop_codon:yes gene_type:complete